MQGDSGGQLADHLQWVKFSRVSWTVDNLGFYYSRYDEPPEGKKFTGANYFQKLCSHRIGQAQKSDKLIYHRDDHKEWSFDGDVTDDGRYLVITISRSTEPKTQIFYKELSEPDAPVVELIAGFDA